MTEPQSIGKRPLERRQLWFDLLVAAALALVLTTGWAITDWQRLSRMLLPDPDDLMRLAQVRDWLAGQGANDWTQYRMAPPHGAPMHWSRVNDIGIAGLILAATPLIGRAHAELFAVLTYPGLLFACALFLSARIGRRLWGAEAGLVAAVLTAVAYPGTTVFIPGRIDHHALQVVLIQLLVLLLMRAPTFRIGLVAGTVTAVSLVVGLETAPQVAVLLAVLFFAWVVDGAEERARLAGFAAALVLGTLFFLTFLRPTLWSVALCDAFTPASSTGTLAGAAALGALAAATPLLTGWRSRLVAGTLLGGAALSATLLAYPSCVNGPYGAMDPFLLDAFMPYIDEANGIAAQPRFARIVAIGGLLALAAAVAAWMVARDRRRWRTLVPIASVVWISALVMLAQVRGAYIGAPLGAPVVAGLVLLARRQQHWRLPAVIGAWLLGAGLAYLALPKQVERLFARPGALVDHRPTGHVLCGAGDAWAQIDRYPQGVVMAGTSVAAYVIGATRHSTVGAGYHRNDDGNMAMYRFFLSPAHRSLEIARSWKVDYVAFCPGDFEEIDATRTFPHSLAAELHQGRVPPWLRPLSLHGTQLRFYRVR